MIKLQPLVDLELQHLTRYDTVVRAYVNFTSMSCHVRGVSFVSLHCAIMVFTLPS